MVEIGTHSVIERADVVTLDLTVRAPQIYPNRFDNQMRQTISHVTLVVRDYDEAIEYYSETLGFMLIEDTALAPGKRWVVLKPKGTDGTALLLAKAATPAQSSRVGDQTGGRVFLFLQTDDFWRDYRSLVEKGVVFEEEPREEPFGTVAVFRDLYGNRWDLIEPATARLP